MEELTINAHQVQEEVLGEILKRNAETEYLKGFLNGQSGKQLFKNNVPIVTYEDIKPYVDRIANGEPSDILLAEPVIEFNRRCKFIASVFIFFFGFIGRPASLLSRSCLTCSSGTSGGQPKLIPNTVELSKKRAAFHTLIASVVNKHFGDLNRAGKSMELMFVKPEIETPSGLKARSVTTSLFKDNGFRDILPMLYTSPVETILCLDINQSMYCQLLVGLIQRDEVVRIGSMFASAFLRAIKFIEDHWKELCSNIKTGYLSDWITDSGCKNALSSIMKPDPELADSIENICGCRSWEGIIRKLWPKAKYIGAITTGVMRQYTTALDFYSGGLPLVSSFYACSEAICGINLEPLDKPADVSYTILPNMAYFEFLPVKKDRVSMTQEVQFNGVSEQESIEMKSNNEDIEAVDLVNVKLGQFYELVVTTFT
ncbi:GH3 family - like 10, partial [Theobroma cacao]